jgi:hypothetical protein
MFDLPRNRKCVQKAPGGAKRADSARQRGTGGPTGMTPPCLLWRHRPLMRPSASFKRSRLKFFHGQEAEQGDSGTGPFFIT